MQQEDDLRGLAKVMQFMRALSLLFALIHFYWYAYSWITAVGWNTALVDKILMNFQRTSGLFSSPLYTKLFCLLFLALSCLGTRSVRSEKISRRRIALCGAAGILLFFCGGWLLRPGYRDMMQQIKGGKVDRVYICRMRQISGKERHLYSFFKRLMQRGVQVTATEYSLRDRVNMFRLARRIERYATRKRRQLPW